jgi:hypothetical protein
MLYGMKTNFQEKFPQSEAQSLAFSEADIGRVVQFSIVMIQKTTFAWSSRVKLMLKNHG